MRSRKNILLARDDVGKKRTNTKDLPAEDFVFGKLCPRDEVGVAGCKFVG